MSALVKLLLLLSALLSALTGVGAGARMAQPAVAVMRTANPDASARPVAAMVETRPAVALPRIAAVALIDGPAWRLAPAAPLYLSRRRE